MNTTHNTPSIGEVLAADFEITTLRNVEIENSYDARPMVICINLANEECVFIGKDAVADKVIDGTPYFQFYLDDELENPFGGPTPVQFFNLVEQKLL
jgi:hypothetical protein